MVGEMIIAYCIESNNFNINLPKSFNGSYRHKHGLSYKSLSWAGHYEYSIWIGKFIYGFKV